MEKKKLSQFIGVDSLIEYNFEPSTINIKNID